MRALVLVVGFIAVAVTACSEKKVVTPQEARVIADGRYIAHANAAGVSPAPLPTPVVHDRGSDTIFIYVEPTSKRKITVIVESTGEVADTVEPL